MKCVYTREVILLIVIFLLPMGSLLAQAQPPIGHHGEAGSGTESDSSRIGTAAARTNLDSRAAISADSLVLSTGLAREFLASDLRFGTLPFRTLDAALFKYDTSSNNPVHKCYEIKKALSSQYEFSFKFLSFDRLSLGYRR